MKNLQTLTDYGLFDARVPRYTSYPPANRFVPEIGQTHMPYWLAQHPKGEPISAYIHIPFCRRLCWFCACRTQGTQTLTAVEAYIEDLITEIKHVARLLPKGQKMERLHLGGGTPTLLPAAVMDRLLSTVFEAFQATPTLEFSVEVDPTDASDDVLKVLASWKMNRASIGVQDFSPTVQDAIGRHQSFEQTAQVIQILRRCDIPSINLDLLYGLPHQTPDSLQKTLDLVSELGPDRLALYGYAHVPHMSKRQVMIDASSLPDPKERFDLAQLADEDLRGKGFLRLGIDHYAKPYDSLARAEMAGKMHRNFQGYTDDPCKTLIGFGASAISQFPQGYSQNAPATAAYRALIQNGKLGAHKGYVMRDEDRVIAAMISQIMCYGYIDEPEILVQFPNHGRLIAERVLALLQRFPDAMTRDGARILILPRMRNLTRIIAAHLDRNSGSEGKHSQAI